MVISGITEMKANVGIFLEFSLLCIFQNGVSSYHSITEHCRGILPQGCSCGEQVIDCINVTDLSTKSFKDIPLNFPHLVSLHLVGNKLEYLEKDLFQLKGANWNLKQLDLSNNRITDIDEGAFINLPQLQQLKLANNQISFQIRPVVPGRRVWTTGSFLSPISASLQILDLSNAFKKEERQKSSQFDSNLSTVLFNSVDRFSALEYVDLSNNDLADLPSIIFRGFPSLEYLYLSGNRLTSFQLTDTDSGILVELHLQSNLIQNLDETFLKMLDTKPTLNKIYLANNSFTCDCGSKIFIDWIKNSPKIGDKDQLICKTANPSRLTNRTLTSIDTGELGCVDGRGATIPVGMLCFVAAMGLVGLLGCVLYANKRLLCQNGFNLRNWVSMANAGGGYEILEAENRRPATKAEAV